MIFLKSSVLCKLLTIDFITGKLRYFFNCHDSEQIQEYTELGILGVGRIYRNNSSEVALLHKPICKGFFSNIIFK
ncbi:hypothetical protein FSC10_11470 [Acinetobacter schindleri]|uniref:Uncharacterized protein n=1 Tax=Acinetobacter schindleri TaxID=108981 RepID=A0AAE6WXG2_9GAMM|nr:hypothetical protein FSC10_11470 [Acinetobacter schindleri]